MKGKIVRTKIPSIIEANGKQQDHIRIKDAQELTLHFKEKIREEMEELLAARSEDDILEEAADVFQIITDYLSLMDYTPEDLQTVMKAKSISRGGFINRLGVGIFLLNKIEEKE
jgi:predicted house-cleaning noncanonical NTP pyrophosphatase (MazG superfamily)